MNSTILKTQTGIDKLYDIQRKRFKKTSVVDEIISNNLAAKNTHDEMQKNFRSRAQIQKLFRIAPDENDSVFEEEKSKTNGDIVRPHTAYAELSKLSKEQLKYVLSKYDDLSKILGEKLKGYEEIRDKLLKTIGNDLHFSVIISEDEKDNGIVKEYGTKRTDTCKSHYEILPLIGLDTQRGSRVSGNRAYFLTGAIAELQLALTSYATQFLTKKGYKLIIPPYFMNSESMSNVAQLEQYDDELYRVSESEKGSYKYLIATSEQPIAAYHQDEILKMDQLPIKYGGYSTCWRREVGNHGKDTAGIFRVHQFDKVEQFCITSPEESHDMMQKMLGVSEEFYQSLEIPYRIISIVSGSLNNSASIKFDIEGFFPSSQTYRELVSCSNCTDYQSKNMNIKYKNKENKSEYVHMLNSTLCALSRTICIIAETYQTNTGIKIPTVLQQYLGYDFISF